MLEGQSDVSFQSQRSESKSMFINELIRRLLANADADLFFSHLGIAGKILHRKRSIAVISWIRIDNHKNFTQSSTTYWNRKRRDVEVVVDPDFKFQERNLVSSHHMHARSNGRCACHLLSARK